METTANSGYIKWKCMFPRDDTNGENMACKRANVSNVVRERAKVTSERGQWILIFVPNPRLNTALSNGTMSNAKPRNNLVSRLISANLLRNFRLPLEDNASVRGLFIPRKLSTASTTRQTLCCFIVFHQPVKNCCNRQVVCRTSRFIDGMSETRSLKLSLPYERKGFIGKLWASTSDSFFSFIIISVNF